MKKFFNSKELLKKIKLTALFPEMSTKKVYKDYWTNFVNKHPASMNDVRSKMKEYMEKRKYFNGLLYTSRVMRIYEKENATILSSDETKYSKVRESKHNDKGDMDSNIFINAPSKYTIEDYKLFEEKRKEFLEKIKEESFLNSYLKIGVYEALSAPKTKGHLIATRLLLWFLIAGIAYYIYIMMYENCKCFIYNNTIYI